MCCSGHTGVYKNFENMHYLANQGTDFLPLDYQIVQAPPVETLSGRRDGAGVGIGGAGAGRAPPVLPKGGSPSGTCRAAPS